RSGRGQDGIHRRSADPHLLSLRPRVARLRALHHRVHARRRGAHPGDGRRGPLRALPRLAPPRPGGRMNQVNEFLRRILFLPPQMSTVARSIDELLYFVILSTMIGSALVTLVGGYFILRYRERAEDVGKPNVDAGARPVVVGKVVAIIGLSVL